MKTIKIATEFYPRLVNRDKQQGDGKYNAEDFRKLFLEFLDNKNAWSAADPAIELDFSGVEKLGPSFANEAFAYFTKYAKPNTITNKIVFSNISKVKLETIMIELNDGYSRS